MLTALHRKKIFIVFLGVFFSFVIASVAFATEPPDLKVKIGDQFVELESVNCDEVGEPCTIGWIGTYIVALYHYGIGAAGILAAVVITVAGFLWLTSAGSPDRITRAKELIAGALSGLLLALFSYIILYAVNPQLTVFGDIEIEVPEIIELGGGGDPAVIAAATQGTYGGTVAPGTHQNLSDIRGHEYLNGSDPAFIDDMDQMIGEMSANGTLPAGFRFSSGLRPGATTVSGATSQHAVGRAGDVAWAGINAENAQAFIDAARQTSVGANLQFIREVTPAEMQRHGSTGSHVHIAFPRR